MNCFLSNHAYCLATFNCVVIYHKHLDVGRGMARNNHLGHMGFQMHLFMYRGSLQKTVLFQECFTLMTNCKSVNHFHGLTFCCKSAGEGVRHFHGLLVSWSKVAGIMYDIHRLYWIVDLYETGLKWKLSFFNFT